MKQWIPVFAGMKGWEDIALRLRRLLFQQWIPAFAGMTDWEDMTGCEVSPCG
jgi:hypothetical protein